MTENTTGDNIDPDEVESRATPHPDSRGRYQGRSSSPHRSSTPTDSLFLRITRRRESTSPKPYSSAEQRLIGFAESEPLKANENRRERVRFDFDEITAKDSVRDFGSFPDGYLRDRHADQQYRCTSNRSSIYDLGTRSDEEFRHSFARTSGSPEWRESEHKLPDGSVTQLRSIHSAEHKVFRDKKEKIILTCPDQEKSSIQLRWLHIQNCNPKIELLEKLVADCPWISFGLKAAALRVIVRVSNNRLVTGDWEANEQAEGAEELVIFLRADYLAHAGLSATPKAVSTDGVVNPLLGYLYGDDVTIQREANLALRKLTLSDRPDHLRIPKLFCLSLGTGLLITMAELSFADIAGDYIEVNDRNSEEFRTIHVKRNLKDKQARPIIIELDCKYADFHRRVVNIAATGKRVPATYDILWAPGGDILAQDILTPSKWVQLLSSEKIEEDIFFLSREHSSSASTTGGDSDNYEESNNPGRFGIWEEIPVMSRDHHTRHKRRDTGSMSPPSTELFMSESVTTVTTRSRFDQDSAYGQCDQRPDGNPSPEPKRSKISGYPVELIREWQKSCSVVENQSSQSPSKSDLDLKRSERTEDEQCNREASSVTFKLMITPGSLIPLFFHGRWFGIVPYSPQRLLKWSNDQVSTGLPSLDELQDRRSGIADDDTNLDCGTGQNQTQTQPATIHAENDGIRVVPLEGRADEGHNRTMPLSRSQSRGHGDPQSKESADGQRLKNSLPTVSFSRRIRVREEQLESWIEGMDPWPAPERNTSYEDRRNGFQEASPKSSGLIIFPFFTWRVKHGPEEHAGFSAIRESDETVVRILAKIHESITSDKSSYRTLYNKAYRCTADDLLLRHPDIVFRIRTHEDLRDDDDTAKDPRAVCSGKDGQSARENQATIERNCSDVESPDDRPQRDSHGLQGGKRKQAKYSASAERDQTAPSSSNEMANPIRSGESPSKFRMESNAYHKSLSQDLVKGANQGLELKAQLLEVSQSIFRAFLPSQSAFSYSDYYHPLCERFWGSLDEIFRQITWSTTLYRDDLRCVIRDLDKGLPVTADLPSDGSRKRESFADCQACQRGRVWDSPSDAMKHIHARHCDCTTAEYKDRLHDDPCSVWIKETIAHKCNQESQIIPQTQDMIALLSKVSGLLNEIQWLVASTARGVRYQTSRPQLPSSLVHAFDALLSYFIFTARKLSLINRSPEQGPTKTSWGNTNSLRVQLRRTNRRCRKVGLSVVELLANAKKDILLKGTRYQENDPLGLHLVGTHFLMAALATVVQNREHNLPEQGAVPTTIRRRTDVINMYKKNNSKLRFEANRRPQKRVVVAIHELEEELRALWEVLATQESTLSWHMHNIEPCHEPYSFEEDYIETQCQRLQWRKWEIERLQQNAAALKLQVGWMIDILEEDHGKAIRVFTVVTLFFLPLSFVTSFMGMNTSDIRDMESNQRLFWSIAVPLTVFVLTAAFIYGYKGDEVADVLGRWLQSRVRSQKESVIAGPRRQTTWLSADSKDSVHEMEEEEREIGRLKSYILRRRKPKAAREEDVGV